MSAIALRKRDVDMTEGSILRHIITFALPLIIGNLFQQLYNMVDAWVVGNYVSNEAFSAVGTVAPIINLFIGFFAGLSSGAGVVISQYYGAKKYDSVKKAVHTSLIITAFMGVLFTILGVILTPAMLNLMNTPDGAFTEARTYLTVYFTGTFSLVVYNMGSGILRAVGDSRRPFYFLIVSSVINIVLDLVFVIVCGMGVAGVAYATVIAQTTSAALILITLFVSHSPVRAELKEIRLDVPTLKTIIRIGIPSAIQLAITSFSNIIVQSYINFFDVDAMSGYSAYTKIDHILFLPAQSFGLAITTFVGQNLGKNDPKRAKRGVLVGLASSLTVTLVLMALIIPLAPYLVAFFNDKPEVVEIGTMMLVWITPFYFLPAINQSICGALRGAGNARTVMIITLSSFVAFRQIYLFVMANFVKNEIIPILISYPVGWLLCATCATIYFLKTKLEKTRIVKENTENENNS